MKRLTYSRKPITATSKLNEIPVMYTELEAAAARSHYDITVYDDFSIDFKYTGSDDFMPDFHAEAIKNNDDRYELYPNIQFPDIQGKDVNYSDSIQYILNTWAHDIGGLCTNMMGETYSNDDYYENEE